MKIKLGKNAYGKNAVNLSKIIRHEGYNDFRQVSVNISLEGDFESAHINGDNTKILPTDTQKNTVFVLAKEFFTGSIEVFGKELARHFYTSNEQVSAAHVSITEHLYARIPYGGTEHPYAFISCGNETHTTAIVHDATGVQVGSGIDNLLIVKTAHSGFEGFIKDAFTTLKETNDRIMATQCKASWEYYPPELDYHSQYKSIRAELLRVFAEHQSLSLQQTMYAMGAAVLEKHATVKEISFRMPNKHHILFNLEQFGTDNNNEVFLATDEPFGYITATVMREE